MFFGNVTWVLSLESSLIFYRYYLLIIGTLRKLSLTFERFVRNERGERDECFYFYAHLELSRVKELCTSFFFFLHCCLYVFVCIEEIQGFRNKAFFES